jgi:hypothetical protein
MAYPNSSDVVAGTQAVTSAVNAIRKDAIGIIDVVSANTWSALQVIRNQAGGFVKMAADWGPTNAEILIAASTGSGGYTSSTAYKPGSIIPGFGGTLTVDAIYYPDGSGNLTTTPGLIRIPLGVALTTSVLLFNPKVSSFKVTPGTSGAALSTGQLVYRKASDAKWYPTDPTSRESGHCKDVGFVAFGAGAADVAINVILPGQIVSGLSGLTAGTVYYPGASGTLSATRGAFSRPLGIAKSTTELAFFPLEPNENFVLEAVTAGENWSARDLLYFKKSDQRYWKADADAAESGICEVPAIAFATHSGGGGSQQLVYMPGSYIRGAGFSFTAGDRLFPSGTAGAYVANTPASYDTFYRPVAHAIETDFVLFTPHAMEFLPTGIQEKGVAAGGWQTDNSTWSAVEKHHTPIVFRKQMVNTPSSLTLTWATSTNNVDVSVPYINRYGASLLLDTNGSTNLNQEVVRFGTYQTVGN